MITSWRAAMDFASLSISLCCTETMQKKSPNSISSVELCSSRASCHYCALSLYVVSSLHWSVDLIPWVSISNSHWWPLAYRDLKHKLALPERRLGVPISFREIKTPWHVTMLIVPRVLTEFKGDLSYWIRNRCISNWYLIENKNTVHNSLDSCYYRQPTCHVWSGLSLCVNGECTAALTWCMHRRRQSENIVGTVVVSFWLKRVWRTLKSRCFWMTATRILHCQLPVALGLQKFLSVFSSWGVQLLECSLQSGLGRYANSDYFQSQKNEALDSS